MNRQKRKARAQCAGFAPRGAAALLRGQDGIALLMVLVVVSLLTAMVVSFTDTTQKHLQVTQHYKDRLQAYWAAQSGLQAATALLIIDAQAKVGAAHDGTDSVWNSESLAYQQYAPLIMGNLLCGKAMIAPALSRTPLPGAQAEAVLPPSPIVDENSKLSLASLLQAPHTQNETTHVETFERLRYLLQSVLTERDVTPPEQRAEDTGSLFSSDASLETNIDLNRAETLAGYLVDWIDSPNNQAETLYNPDRAEEACPEDDQPYQAKDGYLDSIEEIGLVCGFRRMTRATIQKLTQHLTAYSLTTNINTATQPVLHAILAAAEGDQDEPYSETIHEILHPGVADLNTPILQSKADYETVLGFQAGLTEEALKALENNTDVSSSHFRVAIYGVVYDPESGLEQAVSRVQMDLARATGTAPGQMLSLLYYRED